MNGDTICDLCCREDCTINPLNELNCNSVRWNDPEKNEKSNEGWNKGEGARNTPIELDRSLKSNVKWKEKGH